MPELDLTSLRAYVCRNAKEVHPLPILHVIGELGVRPVDGAPLRQNIFVPQESSGHTHPTRGLQRGEWPSSCTVRIVTACHENRNSRCRRCSTSASGLRPSLSRKDANRVGEGRRLEGRRKGGSCVHAERRSGVHLFAYALLQARV